MRVDVYQQRTWWERLTGRPAKHLLSARMTDASHAEMTLDAYGLPVGERVTVIVRAAGLEAPLKIRGWVDRARPLTIRWRDLPYDTILALKSLFWPLGTAAKPAAPPLQRARAA